MPLDTTIAPVAGYEPMYLSKNRIEINIDPASALITDRTKLRYFLTLHVAPFLNAAEADFIDLPEMEAIEEPIQTIGAVTLAKGAYFEISKILHTILEASMPDFALNQIKLNPSVVLGFKITTRVEDDGVEISTHTTELLRVFRGGINEKQTDGWAKGMEQKVFSEFFKAGNEYLTYSPITKVLPTQPQFLSVLVNQIPIPTQLKLRLFAEYTDGTTDATASTVALVSSQAFSMYTLPVGPTQLGLMARTKQVAAYYVWLNNQADAMLTTPKRFEIDHQNYLESRYIIFRNSLSAPESLACVGKASEAIFLTRETYSRNREFDAPATFSEKVTNQVTAERQITINTAWLQASERQWLEDLALSEEFTLVTDRGHVPLTLLDTQYLSHDTDEHLIGRTLTFSFNNSESNYSSLPVPVAPILSGTAWRAYNSGTCQLDAFGKRTGKQFITHLELYYTATNLPVKPAQTKLNTPETEGYIPPQTSAACATPNHLNTALSQQSTFRKEGCANGFQGSYITLSIDAGLYGSEVSVADANAKALAAMLLNDTQAYANTYGICNVAPWAYAMSVPAGRINIRWVLNVFFPNIMLAGGPGAFSGIGTEEACGNHWMVGSSSNAGSLYYTPANNQDMLVKPYPSVPNYFIDTYKAGAYQVYRNGTLFFEELVTQAQITAAGGVYRVKITGSNGWVSLDKVYILINVGATTLPNPAPEYDYDVLIDAGTDFASVQTNALTGNIDWGDGTVQSGIPLGTAHSHTYAGVQGRIVITPNTYTTLYLESKKLREIRVERLPASLTFLSLQGATQMPINTLDVYYRPNLVALLITNSNIASIDISANTLLQLLYIALSPITTINIDNNTALASINISQCSLTVTAVNYLLATARARNWGAGKTLYLNGGANAAPTGQGITDKNWLITNGASVLTN